jgi:hypothetical protein
MEYLPKSEMIVGGVYRVDFRSCHGVGVWDGRGFWALRTKFNDTYAFMEYHWDDGPPYGTARPTVLLQMVQDYDHFVTVPNKPPHVPDDAYWDNARAYVWSILPGLNEKYR